MKQSTERFVGAIIMIAIIASGIYLIIKTIQQ